MTKLKLWGRESSANVQKALWALRELELDFERVDAGGRFGGLDTAEFGAMNPNRLVPVLEDGDLTLWESHAIVRYLAAKYGQGSLWHGDPAQRAVTDQWTDWVATTFQPAWIGVFWSLVRTPPSQRDPEVLQSQVDNTAKALTIMDHRLSQVPYLGGERLTYADIAAGVALYRWSTMDFERPSFGHVEAWHQRLLERPAFVQSVNISYEELRVHDAP